MGRYLVLTPLPLHQQRCLSLTPTHPVRHRNQRNPHLDYYLPTDTINRANLLETTGLKALTMLIKETFADVEWTVGEKETSMSKSLALANLSLGW